MTTADSFRAGYSQGIHSTEITNRQIADQYPRCNVDAFAQGQADGLVGDDWRLCLNASD